MKEDDKEFLIAPAVAVRLSGTGGQGLLLAGRVLAQAAAIHDGLNVVLTNSYGPEARGGASLSQVIIANGDLDELECEQVDVLVCLSQEACDVYFDKLRQDGLLIVDSTNVGIVPTNRVVEIPITRLAREKCQNVMTANIISLGVLCGCSHIVTLKSLKSALRAVMRPDMVELNEKALQIGYDTVAAFIKSIPENTRAMLTRDFSYVREWKPE
jgi:2-oxoglutarate ferredoxin oxidoreductase subunit gamma